MIKQNLAITREQARKERLGLLEDIAFFVDIAEYDSRKLVQYAKSYRRSVESLMDDRRYNTRDLKVRLDVTLKSYEKRVQELKGFLDALERDTERNAGA